VVGAGDTLVGAGSGQLAFHIAYRVLYYEASVPTTLGVESHELRVGDKERKHHEAK